jgi:hypothetical protein
MNNNMNENFDSTDAKEALQNIASIYNKGELTVSKLNVTGDLAVTGDISGAKNLNISGDTSIKKLTADDTTIKKNLLFAPRDNPSGAVSWTMFNSGDRLHTKSNIAGSGGSFIENDYAGKGSINTHWYQPNGESRLVVGTGTQVTSPEQSQGFVQIYHGDGRNVRWQIGNNW